MILKRTALLILSQPYGLECLYAKFPLGYIYIYMYPPMGTSCAPYLANIFLYVEEKKAVTNLVDEGKIDDASSLANVFRYQDDCIVLNERDCLI